MQRLLERLDHPERKLPPVIHVAGTNGKGSTIAYLRAILKRRACACTSSPRPIWCGSTNASGSAAPAAACWSATTNCARRWSVVKAPIAAPITIFEIETAAAFCLFTQQEADVVLLEVGLGGRLDATNVIDTPLAFSIAPVSMDHTEFLGDRLPQIAGEKAAIIKRKVPVICAEQAPEAMAVIERRQAPARTAACRGPAMACQYRARPAGLSGRSRPDGPGAPKLFGRHQFDNAGACDRDFRALDPSGWQRGFQGRHRQHRMAGADPAADSGALVDLRPGRRAMARRWTQRERRPCRGGRARRSRGARIAAAGGDRRHDGEQDARAFLANFAGLTRHIIAVPIPGRDNACRRTGWPMRRARSACAWRPRPVSRPRWARWRGSPTRCRRAS